MTTLDNPRYQQLLDNARECLAGLAGHADTVGLLRRLHDDALAPRAADTSGRGSAKGSPLLTPGDEAGWREYQRAAADLVAALRKTAPGVRFSGVERTSPSALGVICRSIAVLLPLSPPSQRAERERVEAACGLVVRAHDGAMNATGRRYVPPQGPRCENRPCPTGQQNGRYCYRCSKHYSRHGEWPIIAASA